MPDATASAAMTPGPPTEALAGLVERVTFHNADTGFAVLRVKAGLNGPQFPKIDSTGG